MIMFDFLGMKMLLVYSLLCRKWTMDDLSSQIKAQRVAPQSAIYISNKVRESCSLCFLLTSFVIGINWRADLFVDKKGLWLFPITIIKSFTKYCKIIKFICGGWFFFSSDLNYPSPQKNDSLGVFPGKAKHAIQLSFSMVSIFQLLHIPCSYDGCSISSLRLELFLSSVFKERSALLGEAAKGGCSSAYCNWVLL